MKNRYEDNLVVVSEDEIVFRKYYFPFGNKHLPLNQITQIRMIEPSFLGGSWRIWGTGDFRTWSPLDLNRPKRDKIFLALLKGRWRQIAFTVENAGSFIETLDELKLI